MIDQPSPPDWFPHHHNLLVSQSSGASPPSWLMLSPVGPLIYTDQLLAYCIKSALIYTDHPWPGVIYTVPGVHHLISQLRSVPQGLRHTLGQFSWCVDIILYGNVLYVQLGLRHTLKQFTHMLQTMSVVWYLVDSPRSRTMIDPSARVVGYCADRIITNYHGGRSSRAIIGRRAISTSLQASIALRCGYHCNHYNSNHHFIAHHTWSSR